MSRFVFLRAEQDLIVQHLIVDGVLLAVFMFHIERTAAGRAPSAELMAFQKRRATPAGRPPSQSLPSPSMAPLLPPTGVSQPGFMAGNSPYAFPAMPPLSGLPQPAGDMIGPSSSSGHVALDSGRGLLGTNSSPGRMYYPQS